MSLVAAGEDHVSALRGREQFGTLFSLLLPVPSTVHKKKTRQHLRAASCLSGKIMILYINK